MKKRDIPHGWIAEKLAGVIEPRGEKVAPSEFPHYKFIGMDHVQSQTTKIVGSVPATEMKSNAARFFAGDVLYGRLRPYLNKVAQPTFDGLASAEFMVFPDTELIRSSFLKYRLNAADFVSFASHLNEGDRPRVGFDQIGNFELLIPPPAEQERIVGELDELFSELDSGIESLEAVRAQLKIYRQAVLRHAFEGRVTSEWREANGSKLESGDQLLIRIKKHRDTEYRNQFKKWEALSDRGESISKPRAPSYPEPFSDEEKKKLGPLPDKWRWAKIGDLFGVYVGATPSRKNSLYWEGSINWVSSGEVQFHRINTTREKISFEGLENTSTECHPPGTVMLAMIGEGKTRGQAAILEIDACHNQNTAAIRVSETDCLPEYLYYYLFFQYQITRTLGSGNNQKALNKDRVSNMCFPLAPVAEQRELVADIEARMSVIDQIERDMEREIQKAEVLRQSLFIKAFSGKLVAQDPNDVPASVLLGRIRGEKAEAELGKKKIKRKAAA